MAVELERVGSRRRKVRDIVGRKEVSGEDRRRVQVVERELIDARRVGSIVLGIEREPAPAGPKLHAVGAQLTGVRRNADRVRVLTRVGSAPEVLGQHVDHVLLELSEVRQANANRAATLVGESVDVRGLRRERRARRRALHLQGERRGRRVIEVGAQSVLSGKRVSECEMRVERAVAVDLTRARVRVLPDVAQRARRRKVRRHAPRVAQVCEVLVQPRGRRDRLRHSRDDLIDAARVHVVLRARANVVLVACLILEIVAEAILPLGLCGVERDHAVGERKIVPFRAVGDSADLRLKNLKPPQRVLPVMHPLQLFHAVRAARDRRRLDLLIRIRRLARKRDARAR